MPNYEFLCTTCSWETSKIVPDAISRRRDKASRIKMHEVRTGVLKFARFVFWRKILEDTHFVRFHANTARRHLLRAFCSCASSSNCLRKMNELGVVRAAHDNGGGRV